MRIPFRYLLLFFLFSSQYGKAQSNDNVAWLQEANFLYFSKNYVAAADAFREAQQNGALSQEEWLRATRSYAQAKKNDWAFVGLDTLCAWGWSNLQTLKNDQRFKNLQEDTRWQALLEKVENENKKYDQKLKQELESILLFNEWYLEAEDSVRQDFGTESEPYLSLLRNVYGIEKENGNRISKLLDNNNGWIGKKTVGVDAARAVFIAIVHSHQPKLYEKHLDKLKKGFAKEQIGGYYLAYLEDILTFQEKKHQRYGTLVASNQKGSSYLRPVEDWLHINQKRAALGLGTIEEYCKLRGIKMMPPKKGK
jgi:hypothetical protein